MTSQQRYLLGTMKRYHDADDRFGVFLSLAWRRWLLLIGIAAAASTIAATTQWWAVGAFAFGVVLGCILRDIGHYRKSAILRPVTDTVVDWQEVDRLLRLSSR